MLNAGHAGCLDSAGHCNANWLPHSKVHAGVLQRRILDIVLACRLNTLLRTAVADHILCRRTHCRVNGVMGLPKLCRCLKHADWACWRRCLCWVLAGPKQSPPQSTEGSQHGCQPDQWAAGGWPSQTWGRGRPGLRATPYAWHEMLFRGVDIARMSCAQNLSHCASLSIIASLYVLGLSPSSAAIQQCRFSPSLALADMCSMALPKSALDHGNVWHHFHGCDQSVPEELVAKKGYQSCSQDVHDRDVLSNMIVLTDTAFQRRP